MVRSQRKAFTLVELLVVITIIAMLMALLIPAVQAARENGRNITCINNIRQLGQAMISYDQSKDKLPGWLKGVPNPEAAPPRPNVYTSWVPQIFAELGRGDLHDIYIDTPAYFTVGSTAEQHLPTLICPSDLANDSTVAPFPFSYVVNGGHQDGREDSAEPVGDFKQNGMFHHLPSNQAQRVSIADLTRRDGASTTILMAENADVLNWNAVPGIGASPIASPGAFLTSELQLCAVWRLDPPGGFASLPETLRRPRQIIPAPLSLAEATPRSEHPDKFNVVMADGSTKSLNQDMSYNIYWLLMTPHGSRAVHPETGDRIGCPPNWKETFNESDLDL